MAAMIKQLLQLKQPAGATKTTLFTPLTFLTKDNMTPASCWDLPAKADLHLAAGGWGRRCPSLHPGQTDGHIRQDCRWRYRLVPDHFSARS